MALAGAAVDASDMALAPQPDSIRHEETTRDAPLELFAPPDSPQHNLRFEVLPQIRSVRAGQSRDLLIIRKLRQCEYTFSFLHDIPAESQGKEIKRSNLIELNEVIGAPPSHGGPSIEPTVLNAIVAMVEANVLRDLTPPTSPDAPAFDPEEDFYFDPQWPHLQHVYSLFSNVLESQFMKAPFVQQYVTRAFIRKKLQLFRSYDKRERDALKNVLHRVYARMLGYRSYIRSLLSQMYLRHIYDRPDGAIQGIGEMLEISGSIISGFALPIKAEHVYFLRKVLMPMHGTVELETYHAQLAYCVLQFVTKSAGPRSSHNAGDERTHGIAEIVLSGLLRYWPKCNSTKELMFMNEFEEVVDALSDDAFLHFRTMVMQRVTRCLGSMHFQVVERSLGMLQNKKLIGDLTEYADELLLPTLRAQLERHWCKQVRDRIRSCIGFLDNDLDDGSYDVDEPFDETASGDECLDDFLLAETATANGTECAASSDAATCDLTPQPWQRGPKRPQHLVSGNDCDDDDDVNGVENVAKWRRLEGSTVGPKET